MKKCLPYILPIFRSVLFIIGGLLFASVTNQSLYASTKWWPLLCIVFNGITIVVLVLVSKYEGSNYWALIGYHKGQLTLKRLSVIILLMLVTGVGGLYVFGFAIYGYVPTLLIQPIPIGLAILTTVLLPVTIVFAELPLYYGYAFKKIQAQTGNSVLTISYIVFFYALQHSFMPLLFDPQYMLFRFLSFVPLLIVLGILYNKKPVLAPMMIGHGFLDLATGIQILISSLFPAVYELMQQAAG